MWTVCHPMSLTSFTAPNDAAGDISFSHTDEETDSERLMSLPKITQQAVFEPSFVCHQRLSFTHCIHVITVLTSCLLWKTLLYLTPSSLSSLFCPVPSGPRVQTAASREAVCSWQAGAGLSWAICEVSLPRFRVGLVNTQPALLLWAIMAEIQSLNFN